MQFSFPAAKILQKLHICKHSGVFLAKKIEFILLFYARRWLWMLAYGRHLGAQNRGFTLFAKTCRLASHHCIFSAFITN